MRLEAANAIERLLRNPTTPARPETFPHRNKEMKQKEEKKGKRKIRRNRIGKRRKEKKKERQKSLRSVRFDVADAIHNASLRAQSEDEGVWGNEK